MYSVCYLQLLSAKLSQVNSNMPSSPDSSSDSSTSSPHHPYDGPNVEAENSLPGVVSGNVNLNNINLKFGYSNRVNFILGDVAEIAVRDIFLSISGSWLYPSTLAIA